MRFWRPARVLIPAAAFVLVVSGLTVLGAGPAAAAASCTSGVSGDVNGDGYAEVAVGSPHKKHGRGAVNVLYGTSGGLVAKPTGSALDDQYFDEESPGMPGTAGDGDSFGGATVFGDLNGDGCADLAIGAFRDGRSGSVTVLFGGPSGLTTEGAKQFVPDELIGPSSNSDFGHSLAIADLDADGWADLAIGIPAMAVAGSVEAGGVAVIFGGPGGLGDGRDPMVVTQDSPGVPGLAASVNHFGFSLVAGDFDGDNVAELAVAATYDLDGSVQVLRFTAAGLAARQPDQLTLETPGVPGAGTIFDDFGTALAVGDVNADGRDDLAVGAPNADTAGDRGAVYLFPGSAAGLTGKGSQRWTKATPGVPGRARSGDRFGRALAMGWLDAGPTDDLVIGDSGAAVRQRTTAAGTATVLFGGAAGLTSKGARLLDQDATGIAGGAEAHDEFGKAVATAYVQGGHQTNLLIGVPGEKVGSRANAGLVHQLRTGAHGPVAVNSRTIHLDSPGVKSKGTRSPGFGRSINGPFGSSS